MTTKEKKIKSLYDQIECKGKFQALVAEDRGKSPLTVDKHWFKKEPNIPEAHQDRVIELLNKEIALQKKYSKERRNLLK